MAFLHGVPKYAFGTAFDLISSNDLLELQPADDTQICDQPAENQQNHASKQPKPAIRNKSSESSENVVPPKKVQINLQDCDKVETPSSDIRLTERQFKKFLRDAIRIGCRHFDCAPLYKTQHLVGQVLREAIDRFCVPRQQFFICSKLPPNMMRIENIERSIRNSIDELQVNYLDLFLIHAPFATKHNNQDDSDIYPIDPSTGETKLDLEQGLLEQAWLKLADLKRKGLTRFIGLSNVNLDQLIKLNALHHVDVVQNEYHIFNQDRDMFDYCEEIDVHFEAYAAFGSPIRAQSKELPCVFTDPLITRVARRNGLTVPQVIMQWIHQQPLSYVIKCDNIKQLEENLRATRYCSLSVNEMIDLDMLNKNARIYLFDEHKGVSKHPEYPFNVKCCM